jgi:hypothetical protein
MAHTSLLNTHHNQTQPSPSSTKHTALAQISPRDRRPAGALIRRSRRSAGAREARAAGPRLDRDVLILMHIEAKAHSSGHDLVLELP